KGVSGSGKSTLLFDVLYRSLRELLYGEKERGVPQRPWIAGCSDIKGIEHIDKIVNIDQSPIGRTPRSNPATYTGLFTYIREFFANLPESRVRGYRLGRYSFNVKGGRCEACQGDGLIKIEMHFLPDVYVTCELCKRATGRTLDILDEPTTGLHFADIQKLLEVLNRLVESGNTVVVIEHNLDVVRNADWIIDLGPEGGDRGGEVVAAGTPKEV